jgi:sacsin
MTMPGPSRRDFDFSERITSRLRDLVAKYPKGLGLVKEFLQNADDAGASHLRIIYDRRHHAGSFDDPGMNTALGPALIFINDRPFTPDDLQHIQTISDSGKRADAGRTGRFGQGVSTIYSASDEPSLLTGETLVWFDPHRRIQEKNRNAYAWDLGSATKAWPAWIATFRPGGAATDGSPFPGTIFRLPLRTPTTAPRSEIRKEAFTDEDWKKILGEARAMGPALLVFLRSVLKLEILEILDSGRELLRLAIRTRDEDAVRRARAPVRAAVTGRPLELLRAWRASGIDLPTSEFTHAFDVCADGKPVEVETWEVVSGLCRGPNGQLIDQALALCEAEEKVLPWVGAAARREGGWSSGHGGFACFLPLPEAGPAPVWLHGWFALDSSARRNLVRIVVEDQSRGFVAWNRSLMEHGVGPGWASLVERLRGEAVSATHPYDRWPAEAKPKSDVDAACVAGFYRTVKRLPVLRARVGPAVDWYPGTDRLLSLPVDWQARLEEAFSSSKVPVLTPSLPRHVRAGFELSSGGPRHLRPEYLRQLVGGLGTIECPVSAAPKTWLARPEWLIQVAAFCALDGFDKLAGLPLALLADGTLRNFDRNSPIYVVRPEDKALLARFPHQSLDSMYLKIVFDGRPVPSIGVRTLDVSGLVRLTGELTSRSEPPSLTWLQSFFERLEQAQPTDIAASAKAIKALPVVPGAAEARYRPGLYSTPLLPCEDDAVTRALERLGVEFVTTTPKLTDAIERFARRHGGFVWGATAEFVAGVLVDRNDDLDWTVCDDPEVLAPILDHLTTLRWDKLDARTQKGLRRLPILPTSTGARVAAATPNTYVLSNFRPPDLGSRDMSLVDTANRTTWRSFFETLGVGTLDGHRFTADVVLPSFASADVATQGALLRWLRDELPRLELFLEENARVLLGRKIRATAIIPVPGGGLEAPFRLYAPDAKIEELLGNVARKPDPARFSDAPERWRKFFEWLRLRRSPAAADLHAAILELVGEADWQGVEHARPALLRLIAYLEKHWEVHHAVEIAAETTLEAALSTIAWLPARHLTADECVLAAPHEERLFRPDELAVYSIRDLVASQRPVVDGKLEGAMARAVGIVTQPPAHEVLAHFEALRTAPIPTAPKAIKALQSAFIAILRHLGSNTEAAAAWNDEVALGESERTVLLGRIWRHPARIFLQPLTTALRGACSVQDDPELAAAAAFGTAPWKGLELLGVRPSPTHDDWLAVLEELAGEHEDGPLSDDLIKVARGAVLELRTAEDEWLQSHDVFVPTIDQRLVLARGGFLPGDPRIRLGMASPIPLVENIREIVEVAERAGARSLQEALDDRIHVGTRESHEPENRRWTEQHEALLRSEPFQESLQRLAYHQGLRDGETDVHASETQQRLARSRWLRLRIANQVRVESRLVDEPETLVFDLELPSFLDKRTDTLWLATAPPRRRRDEVVRALAQQCGVGDTLALSRLLECEPDAMRALLDEDGIAEIPWGRELDESDVATHDPDTAVETSCPVDEPEPEIGNTTSDEEPVDDPDAASPTSDRAPGAEPLAAPSFPSKGGISRPVDPDAPRPLTHGSSLPWSPKQSRFGRRSEWGDQRLRGYLHALPQSDYDTSAAGPMTGRDAHAAALDEVRRRATEAGLSIAAADVVLDGYDFVLGEGDRRTLLRVVGIDGPWTARGIALTKRDLEAAQHERDRWSLHVVEHACDPGRIEVHVLPNPLERARELRLDESWRSVAGATPSSAPAVGDIVSVDGGRRATVVRVECFGEEHEVELQFDSGEVESKLWQPRWKAGA